MERNLRNAEEEESGEKRPTTGTNGKNLRKPYSKVTTDQPHSYKRETRGKEEQQGTFY